MIDATTGILLDEDKKLIISRAFKEALEKLDYNKAFNYADFIMGDTLRKGISEWLSLSSYKLPYQMVMTQGATGAISHALAMYQNETNKRVLLPDLHWSNYDNIAKLNGYKVEKYQMFNEINKFNIKSYEKALKHLQLKKGLTFIIFNFPCHNPSGYTLDEKEWHNILELINKYNDKTHKIKVLFDLVYNEYGTFLPSLGSLDERVGKYIAYSFSKSLGIYGLRCGVLIYFNLEKSKLEKFLERARILTRGKWGSSNNIAESGLVNLFSKSDHIVSIKQDIKSNIKILKERKELFFSNFDNSRVYPYDGGFFITIKTDKPLELLAYLKQRKIFATEVINGVRFAISRLSKEEIKVVTDSLNSYFLKKYLAN